MGIFIFLLGAMMGGIIEMIIQHPWEDLVEKRFQQILHTGIYRKMYFKVVNFETLKVRLVEAIGEYNFDYAKMLLKQMEWFIEEKTQEEKEEARKLARQDYKKDKEIIDTFKGNKTPQQYRENENKWESSE